MFQLLRFSKKKKKTPSAPKTFKKFQYSFKMLQKTFYEWENPVNEKS